MSESVRESVKKPEAAKEDRTSQARKSNYSEPANSLVDRILLLQRTIGNQAVGRLIRSGALHAKLRIGQPEDIYEQEANRVAEQVMRISGPQMVSNNNLHIQRSCPRCEENKLKQQPIKEEDEEKLRKQPAGDKEEKKLQAKAASDSNPEVDPGIENQIQSMKGGVHLLSEGERAFFEPRFGTDFSQVRVHTDSQAVEAARGVNARAFTTGHDVVFDAGQYSPSTQEGQKLLAHELAHVVQQNNREQTSSSNSIVSDNYLQRTIGDGHDLTSPRFAGDPIMEACYDDEARLTKGARGESVRKVQQALIDLGYDLGPKEADGIYGDFTWNAVKHFKSDQDLGWEWMGDVGPGTMQRLDEMFAGEHKLPQCPERLQFAGTSNIFRPENTCQISGNKPGSFTRPRAYIEFKQEIPPSTSDPGEKPEVYCQAGFTAHISSSGGTTGRIAFIQNIIRSVSLKRGSGRPFNCVLGSGVDTVKYYPIIYPLSQEFYEPPSPDKGSWNVTFKTRDAPSLPTAVECLPVGAYIELFRSDIFRMFVFWEPQPDNMIPLAHVDWEWQIWAGFEKMQDGKWRTMPWYVHGVYMTPDRTGVSPATQSIIREPTIDPEKNCPNVICMEAHGYIGSQCHDLSHNALTRNRPQPIQEVSSIKSSPAGEAINKVHQFKETMQSKAQEGQIHNAQDKFLNNDTSAIEASNLSSLSFRGGGIACGINCPKPRSRPTVGRGSVGCPIPELQEKLNVWAEQSGFNVPYAPLIVDGVFGRKTKDVVWFFQSKHLEQTKYADGIVGPLTWPAIDKAAPGFYGLPRGESIESHGWRTEEEATIHRWGHRLEPTETNFFCGWVTEAEIGDCKDECYDYSKHRMFPKFHLTGGTWCIHANNWWGDDDHGLTTLAVKTYRKTAKLPCTISVRQSMRMLLESGDIEYATHEMSYTIDKETVTSRKDGVESTKKWP